MKGKKIVPITMAAVLGAGVVAPVAAVITPSQQSTQVSALNTQEKGSTYNNLTGDQIQVKNFPTTAELNKEVFVPAPNTEGSVKYNVEITHPRLSEPVSLTSVTAEQNGDHEDVNITGAGWLFTANLAGYYSVRYYTEPTDNKIPSESAVYTIYVASQNYTVTLPQNSYYTVPTILPTGIDVRFPAPTLTKDGEEVTADENKGEWDVRVVRDRAASGEEGDPLTLVTDDETAKAHGSYYTLNTGNTAGTFTVYYRYKVGDQIMAYTYSTHNVRRSTEYDVNDLGITFKITGAPTTATLGRPVTFPSVTVTDKNGKTIESYINIRVEHMPSNSASTVEQDGNSFTFTPYKKGTYSVTYTAYVFYGETTLQVSRAFALTNVKDGVAPKAYVVNDYELAEEGYEGVTIDGIKSVGEKSLDQIGITAEDSEEVKREKLLKALGNKEYAVPSVVQMDETFTLPAIYATDNYSRLNGGEGRNITVRREWKKQNSSTVNNIEGDYNKSVEFSFKTGEQSVEAGTYEIRYVAMDSDNLESVLSETTYTVRVVARKDNSTPTITLPTLPSTARAGETITFSDFDAHDTLDSRLEKHAYYTFDAGDESWQEIELNGSNQYSITIPDFEAGKSESITLRIKFEATNDGKTKGTATAQVVIINPKADTEAPTITTEDFMKAFANANGLKWNSESEPEGFTDTLKADGTTDEHSDGAFGQGDVVILPSFAFNDKGETLTTSVRVYKPDGTEIKINYGQISISEAGGSYTYTLAQGSFTTKSAGVYTIVYSAIDGGNNIVSQTFGIRVRKTIVPTVQIRSGKITETAEFSAEYTLPSLKAVDEEGKEVEAEEGVADYTYTWEISSTDGSFIPTNVNGQVVGFIPCTNNAVYRVKGIVTLNKAVNEVTKIETQTYEITCTDSIKPIVKLEDDYVLQQAVDYQSDQKITLPNAIVTDANTQNIPNYVTLEVTVKKGDKNIDVTTEKESGVTRYSFIPTEGQGIYTITYTATDGAGNTGTYSTTLRVGDCDAPTINIPDRQNVIRSSANVGEKLTIEYSDFTIFDQDIDGVDTQTYNAYVSNLDYVNIYLQGPSSDNASIHTLENERGDQNGFAWTFTTEGTYTLYVSLKDKQGNTDTLTYTIKVTRPDTGSEKNVNSTAGIVLIVIASVLVAGIIVYFVVTGLRKGRPTKKKKVKEDSKIVK